MALSDEQSLFQQVLGRLDRVDDTLARHEGVQVEILQQARLTNGRVTELEKENVAEAARVSERAKILAEMADRQKAIETTKRWIFGTLIAMAAIVPGVLALVLNV